MLGSFDGGLKVNDYTNGTKLIGWEKVSLTDTAPFNPLCQYRFTTNTVASGERMYYPPTVMIDKI